MGGFKRILSYTGFLIGAIQAYAPTQASPAQYSIPDNFKVVQDFRDSWRFYSEQDQSLLPYIPENDVKTNTVYFSVDPSKYSGESLVIALPRGASLWVGDRLVQIYPGNDTLYLPMDSLTRTYSNTTVNMVVYHPDRPISGLLTFAGDKPGTSAAQFDVYPVSGRPGRSNTDVFVLIGLLVIVFFTVLFNLYPKNARLLFNLSFVLSGSASVQETFNPRTITKAQFLYMLALSGLMAFLLLVYHQVVGLLQLNDWLEETAVSVAWLVLSIAFFVLLNLKYLLILLMSMLFNIEEKVYHYFFDILILSMVFYSALFLLVIAVGLAFPYILDPLLYAMVYAVTAYYLLRIILLFIKISHKTSVKNLHLFSYLCTTELLPVIVGIKYFLD